MSVLHFILFGDLCTPCILTTNINIEYILIHWKCVEHWCDIYIYYHRTLMTHNISLLIYLIWHEKKGKKKHIRFAWSVCYSFNVTKIVDYTYDKITIYTHTTLAHVYIYILRCKQFKFIVTNEILWSRRCKQPSNWLMLNDIALAYILHDENQFYLLFIFLAVTFKVCLFAC